MKNFILILLSFNLASCGATYVQPSDGSIIRVDDQLAVDAIDKQAVIYKQENNEKTKGFISTSDAQISGMKISMAVHSLTGDLIGIAKVDGVNASRFSRFTDVVRVKPGKRKLTVR